VLDPIDQVAAPVAEANVAAPVSKRDHPSWSHSRRITVLRRRPSESSSNVISLSAASLMFLPANASRLDAYLLPQGWVSTVSVGRFSSKVPSDLLLSLWALEDLNL